MQVSQAFGFLAENWFECRRLKSTRVHMFLRYVLLWCLIPVLYLGAVGFALGVFVRLKDHRWDVCNLASTARFSSHSFCGQRSHWSHMMLAALAGLNISGTRQIYDRMRASYNSCSPRGSAPAPPLEEWRGVSWICNDLACRWGGV